MNTTLNRPYNIFFQYLDTLLDQTTIYIYKNIHHSASSSRTWNVELYRSIVSLYYLRFNTHAMMVHFTTVYLTSWLPYFLVWIPGSKLHLAQVLVCHSVFFYPRKMKTNLSHDLPRVLLLTRSLTVEKESESWFDSSTAKKAKPTTNFLIL